MPGCAPGAVPAASERSCNLRDLCRLSRKGTGPSEFSDIQREWVEAGTLGSSLVAWPLAVVFALAALVRPAAAVNLSALPTAGKLAFRWGAGLYVYGGNARRLRAVAGASGALSPAWSHDGHYLAYDLPAGPLAPATGIPYVAGAFGGKPAAVLVDGVRPYVTAMAWAPARALLALDVVGGGVPGGPQPGVWLWRPGGSARLLAPATKGAMVTGLAWAADGSNVVYSVEPAYTAKGWDDALYRIALTGAPPQRLYVARGEGIQLAGVWPSGGGVLFWLDPLHSASLAADGLTLMSLAPSGPPRPLAVTLAYPSWIVWRGRSTRFFTVGGSGRALSTNKRLLACDASTASCRPLPQPASAVDFDPSADPSGDEVAFVRARATPNPSSPGVWADTSQLWLAGPGGAGARRLEAPGGVEGVWWLGKEGPLLVAAGNALWRVAPGAAPVRVVGPLLPSGQAPPASFYGFSDFGDVVAWWRATA